MKITDPKIQNQIEAALLFWRSVAETSRVHPSRHPALKGMFEEYTPMTIAEIDSFLDGEMPDPEEMTIPQAASKFRVPDRTLRRRVSDLNIKPMRVIGTCGLYRASDLRHAAGKALNNVFNRKGRRGRPAKLRRD